MADSLVFTEGRTYFLNNGLPQTGYFLLSAKPCSGNGSHSQSDSLAGGLGEIEGTGYERQTAATPKAANGTVTYPEMEWATGSETDWPRDVRSVVLATSDDDSGVAICAWNIVQDGRSVDMSLGNFTEFFTPIVTLGLDR